MSITIELPQDHTAVLTEQKDLTNRQMRQIRNAGLIAAGVAQRLQGLGLDMSKPDTWTALSEVDTGDLDRIDEVQRACVVARLESWSITDIDLPKTAEAVDELPLWLYTPLVVAAFGDLKWTDFSQEGAVDPKVRTANSGASRPRGRARS